MVMRLRRRGAAGSEWGRGAWRRGRRDPRAAAQPWTPALSWLGIGMSGARDGGKEEEITYTTLEHKARFARPTVIAATEMHDSKNYLYQMQRLYTATYPSKKQQRIMNVAKVHQNLKESPDRRCKDVLKYSTSIDHAGHKL